ncbi:ABC transporter permease [Actinacidiphila yeochonensis]|uniref:ABC transporter permease n=1 Tax=Actinacidiphila yeochonensis TaxID=89050 RepID=UPI0006921186|nr:ABC transporter permease [Actinacidiphila yeochonensis]
MSLPLSAGSPLRGCNRTVLALEIRRVLRNVRTVVLVVVMPTSFFLLYGLPSRASGGRPAAQTMVSMAAYGAMVGAAGCGAGVAVERALGWQRQLRLTPMRPLAQVAVKAVTAMVLGLVSVAAEFVLGAAFGVRLGWGRWLLAAAAAWLPALLFAVLGLLCGLLLPAANVMQLAGPGLALLAVFGGLFVPLEVLPRRLRDIAPFTPAYGPGALARAAVSGGGVLVPVLGQAAWTVLFGALAVRRLRRDIRRT